MAGAAATIASYPFDILRTTLAAQGEPKVDLEYYYLLPFLPWNTHTHVSFVMSGTHICAPHCHHVQLRQYEECSVTQQTVHSRHTLLDPEQASGTA